METRYIPEFLALVELGSSYAAAEKLFCSQSSLLRHVQTIEEETGEPLFERTRRGFKLNEAGRIFLPYAQKIALLQAQCMKAIGHEKAKQDKVCLYADGKIIDLIADFKQEYPDIDIEYLKREDIEEGILDGDLDVGFISHGCNHLDEISQIPFFHEEVLVLVYEGHPLAARESVTLEELKDERFIALCGDLVFDEAFLETFRRASFVPEISAMVPTSSDILLMVSKKLGITLFHGKKETLPETTGIKAIQLNPAMEFDVYMCYLKNLQLSSGAKKFVQFAKKWKVRNQQLNLSML